MYECNCGRTFSSKRGLSMHGNNCSEEPKTETIETETKVENEVESSSKNNDNTRRRIAKLIDARKSTWDAETRHLMDIEIKALEKSIR